MSTDGKLERDIKSFKIGITSLVRELMECANVH